MKPEMCKIIVERPRVGGGYQYPKGEKKEFQKTPLEDSPKREKIRLKWKRKGCAKKLSERLGPLHRWLLSKVGQPWNKVYKEICENLRRENAVQDHVRDHVGDFVETCVIMVGKVPCHGEGMLYGLPISSYRREKMYVHPVTGLLLRVPPEQHVPKPPKELNLVKINETLQCHKIDGIWYMVGVIRREPVYREVKIQLYRKNFWYTKEFVPYHDMLLGHVTRVSQVSEFYGGYYQAVSKRQMNKKEIKGYIPRKAA